jgi:hypothetical protein
MPLIARCRAADPVRSSLKLYAPFVQLWMFIVAFTTSVHARAANASLTMSQACDGDALLFHEYELSS